MTVSTPPTRASKQKGKKGSLLAPSEQEQTGSTGQFASHRKYSDDPHKEWLEMRVRSGVYNDIPWSVWAEVFEQVASDLRRNTARNPGHLKLALDLLLEGFLYDQDEWRASSRFIYPEDERDCNGQPYSIGTIRLPIDPFREPALDPNLNS